MSTWKYQPETKTTGNDHGIIRRVQVEECVERLRAKGIRNRRLIADVLLALTSLSRGEIDFTIALCFEQQNDEC